jgi:hypothetical protein
MCGISVLGGLIFHVSGSAILVAGRPAHETVVFNPVGVLTAMSVRIDFDCHWHVFPNASKL